MENQQELIDKGAELVMTYGVKLAMALLVLVIGWWISNRVVALTDKAVQRSSTEPTLASFLHSMANIMVKGLVLIIFASMIGIQTASLIALLGAAGLAIGLALQGSLANFAGGILILLFKPFKVGDVIDAQSYVGVVQEIQIFNTILKTLDNQRVIIPNGILSNGCVKNVFIESTRRVDMKFGISYGDDMLKAKKIIAEVLAADENVLQDPAPDIYISGHGDSAVMITVRPWCESANYWPVYFNAHEAIKLAFDERGISIPFPQRDVHIHQQ
jgi:small conductance mechanosensitive channel